MQTSVSGRNGKAAVVSDYRGGVLLVIRDSRTGEKESFRYRDHSEQTMLRVARKILSAVNPDPSLPVVPFSDVVESLSRHVERAN